MIRTWMFLIALLFAAPAVAQDSPAEPNETGSGEPAVAAEAANQGAKEADTDTADDTPWAGIVPRVDTLDLSQRALLISVPQEDAPADAIAAFQAALEAQSPRILIDDSALGVAPETPDAGIVKAAENQPVDRIVIVRFFPPIPTMIVTVYDTSGKGLGNFALEKGDTSPPPAPSLEIADGGEAESSPDETPKSEPEVAETTVSESTGPSEGDLERYERDKWTLESFDDSGIVIRNGETDETFEGPEALEILGQAELADSTRDNLSLKRTLYWTGGGIAGAGLVSLLIGFFTIPAAFDADQEIPTGSVVAVVGGFSGIFIGIVTAVVGWNIDAVDATRKEARGWVDEKNAPLRESLDIPPHLSRTVPSGSAVQFSWSF